MQGHDLLRTIRARNESVPIVVLSSRGDEAGKVQALDFGADDYVTKPFGMDELLARMRAALRHQLQTHGERPVFRVGDLSVDLVRRIVKAGDKDIKLSPKEYDLLRVLVQHAGKVLTHKFLLGELWDDLTDAQYLRVYVRQLRQKIEADPERPHYVLTETGIGYRLRAPGLSCYCGRPRRAYPYPCGVNFGPNSSIGETAHGRRTRSLYQSAIARPHRALDARRSRPALQSRSPRLRLDHEGARLSRHQSDGQSAGTAPWRRGRDGDGGDLRLSGRCVSASQVWRRRPASKAARALLSLAVLRRRPASRPRPATRRSALSCRRSASA